MQGFGTRAIVIGGSIVGLMTARVLSDFFDQVTVLERDQIEDHPANHKSVPQGSHLHALLVGGQWVLSALCPNFTDKLERLGAVRMRMGAAEVVATPWALAAASDFANPKFAGERPPELEDGARYFAALDALAAEDVEVHRLIYEVFGLSDPLSCLSADPLRSRVLERQRKQEKA